MLNVLYLLTLWRDVLSIYKKPSACDLQAFSRVLPTSRVGYHAGKPIESVVYCLTN